MFFFSPASEYMLFYKELLSKEPTCRRPEIYGTTKDKIAKELFNFEYFYHCK